MSNYILEMNFVIEQFQPWLVKRSKLPLGLLIHEYYRECTEGKFRISYISLIVVDPDPIHPLRLFPPSLLGGILKEVLGINRLKANAIMGYVIYLVCEYFHGNSKAIPDKTRMVNELNEMIESELLSIF